MLAWDNAAMACEWLELHPVDPQRRWLQRAADRVRAGAVIAYPTDSCYAFGCRLDDKDAAERIRGLREFDRKHEAKEARRLVTVPVKLDGPFGVALFGDPHVDDPGTDIRLLESHMNIVRRTKGLMAGNVGDYSNNWIGRLARLHAEQTTAGALGHDLLQLVQVLRMVLAVADGAGECPADGQGPHRRQGRHRWQWYHLLGAVLAAAQGEPQVHQS